MTEPDWWRSAVIYQVYIRSFADGNGDGTGDIAGIRARLDHLARPRRRRDLDQPLVPVAAWPTAATTSPTTATSTRAFGTIAEAEALIAEAHARGLRVLLDIVPNHTLRPARRGSAAALAAGPGSPGAGPATSSAPGKGPDGAEPPNDWQSIFGGPAWTRVTEADGSPASGTCTCSTPEQPDLNWTNPEVRADFETTLRFWFDRGVDGFRIDVAQRAGQAGRPARRRRPRRRGRAGRRRTRTGTATACTRSSAPGAGSPTPTTRRACSSPRPG